MVSISTLCSSTGQNRTLPACVDGCASVISSPQKSSKERDNEGNGESIANDEVAWADQRYAEHEKRGQQGE